MNWPAVGITGKKPVEEETKNVMIMPLHRSRWIDRPLELTRIITLKCLLNERARGTEFFS